MNILSGFHSIIAYINTGSNDNIAVIYYDEKRKDKRLQTLLQLAKEHDLTTESVNSDFLDKTSDNSNHQGVIVKLKTQIARQTYTLEEIINGTINNPNTVLLILDGITDPHNLGAIIRTAHCFDVAAIILPKDNSANVDSTTVAKTSSGAMHRIPIITVTNITRTIEKLKDNEFWIAGTTLTKNSISLFEFKPQGKIAWVVGSEGKGIRRLVQENCDFLITIPINNNTQSLNVSVATGIILSHTRFTQNQSDSFEFTQNVQNN